MSALKDYAPRVGPVPYATSNPSAANAGGNPVSVTVSLTAAQIIAMGTTPITIIAAPGTGKAAQITGTAGEEIVALRPVQTATGSVVTKEVGIDITNATAAFAAGTGTAKLFITYRVVTL